MAPTRGTYRAKPRLMTKNEPSRVTRNFANRLRDRKELVIQSWVERMRCEVPPAAQTRRNLLVNSLPHFLDELIASLNTSSPRMQEAKEQASEHAEQRADLETFSLAQLLKEYKILRQVIFDVIEAEEPIPTRERNLILDFIQTGMIEAAAQFEHLQTEKLSKAYELERAARDQFVATLSHDLKTPLATARLAAQLLMRRLKDSEHEGSLARTIRNIDRADKMIENLLDVSLIRVGQAVPLAISQSDLVEIVRDAVSELSAIYGDRFEVIIPSATLPGFWSTAHLGRCVENLLTNAVKYGADGLPVSVTVEDHQSDVYVKVHNWGNTIEPDQLNSIFDPFRRSTSANRSGKKGWGLGLTLVKGVVEAHGGDVLADSSKDEGTTFTIRLPKDCRKA